MKNKLTKYGMMIIAAVLLIAMAFAGAASAAPATADKTITVNNWNEIKTNITDWNSTGGTYMLTLLIPTTFDSSDAAGNVDAIITSNVTIKPAVTTGEVTLDAKQQGRLFSVHYLGNLTVCGNGSATLILTGGLVNNNGGCIEANQGTISMYSGCNITNCISTGTYYSGGGVEITGNKALFNFYGGNIINCTASMGGGVMGSGKAFNMYGGTITDCKATGTGGGGVLLLDGIFTMTGGTITGCSALKGNGILTRRSIVLNETANIGSNDIALANSGSYPNITVGGGFANSISNITFYDSTFAENPSVWLGQVIVNGSTDTTKFKLSTSSLYSGYKLSASGNDLVLAEYQNPYVEVSTWAGLNKSVSEWTDTTEARVVAVSANITDRVAGNDTEGIYVKGKVILTTTASPAGGNKAVVNGNGIGRLFNVTSTGNLTLVGNGTATLNLTGGSYLGDSGGAIIVDGNLTMNTGAMITNSTAQTGGGVYVSDTGRLTMTGGKIANCIATAWGGAVLHMQSTFIMTGGEIADCEGGAAGGVYNYGGTFTMTGGNITGCEATVSGYGGAGVMTTGTFTMTGGSITNCSLTQTYTTGGGVWVAGGTFNVNNTATVKENTNMSGGSDNVYLDANNSLNLLAGGITGNIGIKFAGAAPSLGTQFGTAASGATGAGNIFADDDTNLVGSISGTNLIWAEIPKTYVEVNTWAGLNKSISEWTDTTEARVVAINTSILDRVAGNNTDGIKVNGKIILTTNASPVGNKAVINGNGLGRLFYVQNGGDLTLRGNLSKILNLTGGNASVLGGDTYGGAIYVDGGTLSFNNYAVIITNCSASHSGGAIYLDSNSTFTMNGGNINTCKAKYGGGVMILDGMFTMNDGSISRCEATEEGGGVFVDDGTTFTMNDGRITNCTATYGGGVSLAQNSRFTMTDGSITGCSGPYSGSLPGYGVSAVMSGAMFNVSDSASIYDNKNGSVVSNVLVDSYASCLNLIDDFYGEIGIGGNAGFTAGDSFGNATGTYSGAEKFFADENANLVGSISSDKKLVWKKKSTSSPTVSYSSSSKHSGSTQIMQAGTPAPTQTPVATPTPVPTPASTSIVNPSTPGAASEAAQPTQSSPAPIAGIIAGLGAGALLLRLRK